MQHNLYDTIQSHIKDFESQLYTTCPAVVNSYNPANCTVDVYPAIYRAESDGLLVKDQLLVKVPLHFQATQEIGVTFPIRKGDTVMLVFSHGDMDSWLSSSSQYATPDTLRKHSINDAIAIAGVFKYSKSPVQAGTEEDLNIRYNGSFVRIKANGDILIDTAAGQNATFYQSGDVVVNASSDINVTGGSKVTVTAPDIELTSSTEILMTAPLVNIDADEINFGGAGGAAIARVGDQVTVIGGSSAGVHLITSGSPLGRMN